MGEFLGARPPFNAGVPVIALQSQIFAVVGNVQTVIARPSGDRVMAFKVEAGDFRFKVGGTTDTLAAPGATDDADGDQSVNFAPEDGVVFLSMPNVLTVQGGTGSDILTYWFLP